MSADHIIIALFIMQYAACLPWLILTTIELVLNGAQAVVQDDILMSCVNVTYKY